MSTLYLVHCFTEKSVGTQFPENTYECETIIEVSKILKDCSYPEAGIELVLVEIKEVVIDG